MIKVLHIVTSLSASGVPAVLYNYYSRMDRYRIAFDFVAIPSDVEHTFKCKFEELGSQVFYMPKKYPARISFLYRIIKNGNYDIVHSHIELASSIYLLIAKIAGVKVRIAHAHMAFLLYNKFYQKGLRFLLNYVTTMKMGCSVDAIHGLFGQKTGVVLHNAIDIEKYKYDSNIRKQYRADLNLDSNTVIGFVGRLTYQKNIFYILDIFNEYCKLDAKAVLLIIGDGELKETFFNKVAEMKIEERVIYIGSRNDVSSLMMAMDCLLLPSRWEGLGMVLIEAQAASLLCYTSRYTVPYEDTKISQYIKYIDIKNTPEFWAHDMKKNISNYQRLPIGTQLMEHHYDINKETMYLTELYEDAIK